MNWNLIAKYVTNECTDEEKELVKSRIQSDQEFATLIQTLQTATRLQEKPSRPVDIEAMWHEFQEKASSHASTNIFKMVPSRRMQRARRLSPVFRLAAMVIIALSFTLIISQGLKHFSHQEMLAEQYETINVNNGGRLNVSLSDGSQVTVDAGSELRYFTRYENERHVYLKGEAAFNVAHDAERPFYVHAGNAIIRVVGTRFNVRSWEANQNVVVTVAEGRVLVGLADSLQSPTTLLTKGEQSTITSNQVLPKKYVDPEQYFAWMKNEIYFENAPVKEVVSQLERWYNLKYEFEDRQALDEKITIQIRRANIDEVNRIISLVTGTTVVRDGKVIHFCKRK